MSAATPTELRGWWTGPAGADDKGDLPMLQESTKRKGATWKRFVAGFAIAAAATMAGAGATEAGFTPPPPPPGPAVSTVATTSGGSTGTGSTVKVIATARSGIRW